MALRTHSGDETSVLAFVGLESGGEGGGTEGASTLADWLACSGPDLTEPPVQWVGGGRGELRVAGDGRAKHCPPWVRLGETKRPSCTYVIATGWRSVRL